MPAAGVQQKGHRFGARPIPVREMQHVIPEFQISFDGFGEYFYVLVQLVDIFEKIGEIMYIVVFFHYQMNIGDWTSNRWITCFANEAEQVLGKTSEEIGRMMDENKEEADAYLQAQHFRSFLFKLRTKVEFYGDSSRNKITAQSITPVNHKDYNDFLVKNIEKLTGISKR